MPLSLLGKNGEILSVYQSYKCELFTTLAKIVLIMNKMEWGWKLLTGLRHTMVFVRRPFFHYDPARCGMPNLYGTVYERDAKTIGFNTLWQWKGYTRFQGNSEKKLSELVKNVNFRQDRNVEKVKILRTEKKNSKIIFKGDLSPCIYCEWFCDK